MQKIQKLNQLYSDYLLTKRSGKLVMITQLFKDVDVQNYLDEHQHLGSSYEQKFYMLYHKIETIPICEICLRPKSFKLKLGFHIHSGLHHVCYKKPYNRIYQSYIELYNMKELINVNFQIFYKKFEIPGLIDSFLNDHPEFKNYKKPFILTLFSSIKTEEDLKNIPFCKYCKKFKVSISHKNFYLHKTVIFNDYCTSCAAHNNGFVFVAAAKKLGITNFSQLESVKKKKEETSLKNNGTVSPMQCEKVRNKRDQNMIDKWGVKNPSQLEEVKKKKEETLLSHYGSYDNFIDQTFGRWCRKLSISNASQLDFVKQKKIESSQRVYNTDNVFQAEEIKKKTKDFFQKNYGCDSYSQTSQGRLVSRNSCIDYVLEQYKNQLPVMPRRGSDEFLFVSELRNRISNTIYENIRCYGYFIDFYILDLNLCIEFDEPHHYQNGYSSGDIIRQQDLTEYLNCNFYRIKQIDWNMNKEQVFTILKLFLQDKGKVRSDLKIKTSDNIHFRLEKDE